MVRQVAEKATAVGGQPLNDIFERARGFWPKVSESLELPHEAARENRIESRRRLLALQAKQLLRDSKYYQDGADV